MLDPASSQSARNNQETPYKKNIPLELVSSKEVCHLKIPLYERDCSDKFFEVFCSIAYQRLKKSFNSRGGSGTKIYVYLPYRGAISFYVYIVPLGLINIFLHVERDKISCGLQPTRFSRIFL